MKREEASRIVDVIRASKVLRHPLNRALARLDSAEVESYSNGTHGVCLRYVQSPFWDGRPIGFRQIKRTKWVPGVVGGPSLTEIGADLVETIIVEPLGSVWEHLSPDKDGVWWWGERNPDEA